MAGGTPSIAAELRRRFGDDTVLAEVAAADGGEPIVWIAPARYHDVLAHLKAAFPMLYDLSAVDERVRRGAPREQPASDFSLLVQLLSVDANRDVRLRVPLTGEHPTVPTVTDLFRNAAWYEREAWDMFGVRFDGHARLRRILMPEYWRGHPLRKEHPCRRTDLEPYQLGATPEQAEEERYEIDPEELGFEAADGIADTMVLNLGPHHPGTHGLVRYVLQLEGERIRDLGIQIGFHHRAQEKLAERQTFHTYAPYPDRIDYLAGYNNELPYVLAVEKLGGIEVPPRAQMIRVLLGELFRIANHVIWFGTFGTDLGSMSAVFFTFNDREHIFKIIEAVSGFRMHPSWFRVGGVADDLPQGWKGLVDEFVRYFRPRIEEYQKELVENRIFKKRTQGIGAYTRASAIDWGVTGPNLRATGVSWDLRKARPYSGYDQLEFEVPTAEGGDCFARTLVRMEEMRQSLRLVEQAARRMPGGPYKSEHALTMPPMKDRGTMTSIETLIHHFLSVSWGKPFPIGEAQVLTEAPKGNMSFWVVSDGAESAYRARIRAPTFPIIQSLPAIARGLLVSDLIAILGSIDYVAGDFDR